MKHELVQGTPEWHAFRKLRIGASDIPIILGVSPYKNAITLYEEKLGLREQPEGNFATSKGHNMETIARRHYEFETGIPMVPTVMSHKDFPFLFASLDGFNEANNLILEIKCPGKEAHQLACEGKIPEVYFPQVQQQLFVAGADICHYWSFDGLEGKLVYVHKNEAYINDILLPAALDFHRRMVEQDPPASVPVKTKARTKVPRDRTAV